MAKFLNTTGVSHYLEELIKGTKERLILISPYLKFTDRIKEHIQNLRIQKKDIRIIYREAKLHPDESIWLEQQVGVRTSICKNLHAKCYLNESEVIITSMNLYEFSQMNNNEMGIYISKTTDPDLYNSTLEEVNRLLTISEEIRVTVHKVTSSTQNKSEKIKSEIKPPLTISSGKKNGFCIRTGIEIPFNIDKPLSYEAYKAWNKFGDKNYPEKFCHFSGEASKGETSVAKPILKKELEKS